MADPDGLIQLALDRSEGRHYPLTQQVADELRRGVHGGQLQPGRQLPPVRQLARQLGVTPETVANAYRLLVEEGALRGEVGRGTFVAVPGLRVEEDPLAPFEWPGGTPDRTLLRLADSPGVVSFTGSVAAPDLAPVEPLRLALDQVLREQGGLALQVGPTEGLPPLRAAIASLLEQRGIHADPGSVCVTSGCQQGIDLAAKVLVGPGDAVLVEQPSFLGALEAFRARGARLVGVPVDEQGLVVDALPDLIRRYQPRLLYCMPTYQNPTGRSLARARRGALLSLAAASELPIVEDDSAGFLPLDQPQAPQALMAEDEAGVVIHLGTFSKLIAAGLRLGWLVAPPALFQRLVAAKYASDLSSDALVQRAVERLCGSGDLARHLATARAEYRRRRDALVAALARWGFPGAPGDVQVPAGGFNLWLQLPPAAPSATTLYLEAIHHGVAFMPGPYFFSGGSAAGGLAATHGLRLSFSALPPEAIERGVGLLALALAALQPEATRGTRVMV